MNEYISKALENPDFFTTIIILWFVMVFFVPVFWYLLRWQTKQNNNIITEMEKGFTQIALSVWKTTLSNKEIIDIARNKVWFASETKLVFIRSRLEKNDLQDNQMVVESHITAVLISETAVYVDYLNGFQIIINGKIYLVWDRIAENFDMKWFLKEIFDVIFSEKTTDEKIVNCRIVMMSYQGSMFEDLRFNLK